MATIYSSPTTITVKSSGSTSIDSSADWKARISGPGVVWHHSFDTAAEVNQFRWAGKYGSGNDPLARSPGAGRLEWVATGGADGGGYMRLTRFAGPEPSSVYWWRPFSPLTSASNGRGVADPAANGTIPLQSFTPTDGGDQTTTFSTRQRSGYYGLAQYQAAGSYGKPTYPQFYKDFDGQEFYLQVRVKVRPDRMTSGNPKQGKMINFSTTDTSYTSQELVTVSGWPMPSSPVGGPYQNNIHNMYEGAFYGNLAEGSANAISRINNRVDTQWYYSNGWDTLLYHIRPGSQNGDNPPFTFDTLIEVWAARQGVTSYTKIWDVDFRAIYQSTEEFRRHAKFGWNAFICWVYQGDSATSVTDIVQSYDQIIFSKQMIPCPAV